MPIYLGYDYYIPPSELMLQILKKVEVMGFNCINQDFSGITENSTIIRTVASQHDIIYKM